MTTTTKKPTHFVYAVREGRDEDSSFWTKIGAAFAHNDGKGLSLILDALPVNGRLIIRRPKEKESNY